MNNVDKINHPPHYTFHQSGIECIEVTRHCSFSMGNAIKYIWRYDYKNGSEDLEKATWYLTDVVRSGRTHYLPFKAKQLLETLVIWEENRTRYTLFKSLIENGAAATLDILMEEVAIHKALENAASLEG